MNILLLISDFNRGGAERAAALLANAWTRAGHSVTLMPTFSGPVSRAYPLDPAVVFLPLEPTIGPLPFWLRKLFALRRTIRDGKFDVVCSFLTNVNIAAVLATRAMRTPVVVSERVHPPSYPLGLLEEFARRVSYPFADRIVMQTGEGIEWLEGRGLGKKGRVIPNPVQHPLPGALPTVAIAPFVRKGRRLLLGVGRLVPQKRFDWLIDAFAQIAGRFADWDLAILGEGPEHSALSDQIRRAGLGDRVILPGAAGNLGEWYTRADAFALTSAFEGFPNVLAEALAYGVPSLAIDCPSGPRELLCDERIGILLDRDTTRCDLAIKLGYFLSLAWPQSIEAAADIRRKLDVGTVAQQWLDLFRELNAA